MPRPVVAIVSNALAPYRLHFHLRLAREMAGIEWWSLFTHDVSNAPWKIADEAEIRPVKFGPGEAAEAQGQIRNAWHEYRKGGRVIQWLVEHRASAVVLLGYNDTGRVRIIRWCHRHGVPLFLWGDSNARGDLAAGVRRQLKRLIVPRLIKQCAGVLACGSLGRAYFQSYGASPERIWYMPVEPDYDLIDSVTSEQVAAAYSRFHLPRDRRYFLYCGRLADVKRVDLLVGAFAEVAHERPEWDVIVIGDGPLRADLQAQVPSDLMGRFHWLGFLDDQPTIASLQRGAQVFVLPSDFEPWGVAVNEAVAAGLAVVVSDAVGAAPELARDGVNGRVVPRGDREALASALRKVTDPATLQHYQSASAQVLADWRRRGDPVAGLKSALASVGVIATT